MAEATEQDLLPGADLWEETTVVISRENGPDEVPAMVHPWIPGLAVTMRAFGTFNVTHVPTGLSVWKSSERVVTAAGRMVMLAPLADWTTEDAEEIWEQVSAHPNDAACPLDGFACMGDLRAIALAPSHGDEFPWEEEHPWTHVDEDLAELGPPEPEAGDG